MIEGLYVQKSGTTRLHHLDDKIWGNLTGDKSTYTKSSTTSETTLKGLGWIKIGGKVMVKW